MARASQVDSQGLTALENSLFLSVGGSCDLLLANRIQQKCRDVTALIRLHYMAKMTVLDSY